MRMAYIRGCRRYVDNRYGRYMYVTQAGLPTGSGGAGIGKSTLC